jgi:hypothetical protein
LCLMRTDALMQSACQQYEPEQKPHIFNDLRVFGTAKLNCAPAFRVSRRFIETQP